jgi:hypothetical protein
MPTKKPKANKKQKLTAKKLETVKPLDVFDAGSGALAGRRVHRPANP